MAKKKSGKRKRGKRKHGGHHPTAKAKKAYNALIVKNYRKLHRVVKKHAPYELLDA